MSHAGSSLPSLFIITHTIKLHSQFVHTESARRKFNCLDLPRRPPMMVSCMQSVLFLCVLLGGLIARVALHFNVSVSTKCNNLRHHVARSLCSHTQARATKTHERQYTPRKNNFNEKHSPTQKKKQKQEQHTATTNNNKKAQQDRRNKIKWKE